MNLCPVPHWKPRTQNPSAGDQSTNLNSINPIDHFPDHANIDFRFVTEINQSGGEINGYGLRA